MADEPANLVLEHLRHIRGVVDATREDMHDLRDRMAAAETAIVNLATNVIQVRHSLDRLSDRVERIDKRLGLIGEPA